MFLKSIQPSRVQAKMFQEQAAAAVIIAIIFGKNKSRKKRKRMKSLGETLV